MYTKTFVLLNLLALCSCLSSAQGFLPGSQSPGTATIYGQVLLQSRPVVGGQISAYLVGALHGRSTLIKQCLTWTDDKGAYTCGFLPAGKYLIVLEGYGRSRHDGRPDLPAVTFFPNTSDLRQTTFLELRNAMQQNGDFALNITNKGYSVAGLAVQAPSGGTLGLYMQSDEGFDYRLPLQATLDKRGTFRFYGVSSGAYVLRGRGFEGRTEYDVSTPLQVRSRDIEGVKLRYLPQLEAELSIHAPENQALAQAFVMEDVGSGHRAHIERTGGGHFRLSELVPGDYVLYSEDGGSTCVREITVDGREAILPLHLTADATPTRLEVDTTRECFSISGNLTKQQAGVVVLTDTNLQVMRTAHANRQGKFVLNGLRPGHYRAFAWPSVDNVPYRNARLLREHSEQSTEFTIEEQERLEPISLPVIGG